MKNRLLAIVLILLPLLSFSQSAKILDQQATRQLLDEMGAPPLPVLRAYEYGDNKGVFNLLLCEDRKQINGTDTLRSKIAAICYLNDHGGYLEQWQIKDFAETAGQGDEVESNIWFWTKYCSITDLDNDKTVDPVIVYGTVNEYGIRRIKIITLYKGKKYAIRAVECDLDPCRTLKVDDSFKTLPVNVRHYIEALMQRIRDEQHVLLKNG